MGSSRVYENAPITEALIDIRTKLPEATTIDTLSTIQLGPTDSYPTRRHRYEVSEEVNFDRGVSSTVSQSHVGFDFVSHDALQMAQARLDGFTFSRFLPYTGWDQFRADAKELWETYRSFTDPVELLKVAVRYVNRIDIPIPIDDFKDYLRTSPEVSPDLPQALSGYLMQLHIPQNDLDATVVLTEAIVGSSTPDNVSILLDIDLFKDVDIPQIDEDLWSLLDDFRVKKNDVFEACITDRTRELIDRART